MSYPMPHLAAVPTMYRPPVSDAQVAIAWVATVLTAGYMLPWAIAATTRKSNTASIALIDLLLGWTFIGWVAALVMACLPEPVAVAPVLVNVVSATPPPGWYPDAAGVRRYWNGAAWTESTI